MRCIRRRSTSARRSRTCSGIHAMPGSRTRSSGCASCIPTTWSACSPRTSAHAARSGRRPSSTACVARDGRVVWVSETATFVTDEATGDVYWQGVMVDITARKQAQVALEASERRFTSLFEAASIGVRHARPRRPDRRGEPHARARRRLRARRVERMPVRRPDRRRATGPPRSSSAISRAAPATAARSSTGFGATTAR